MLKKAHIYAGCIIAAVSGVAGNAVAASSSSVQKSPLTGPYVGVYGGYDWSDISGGADPDGWDGGVFAGYKLGAIVDQKRSFGIGANSAIEAFYGVSSSNDSSGGGKASKNQDWGVSFRPGISFLDVSTLDINPYGILGYRNTEFKIANAAGSQTEHFSGFDLGIGSEVVNYGNVGVRLEYTHTWYNSERGFDPSSDNLRFGLSYHF